LDSALALIATYLYTKFDLNPNSGFKVICRTRYRTDRQSENNIKNQQTENNITNQQTENNITNQQTENNITNHSKTSPNTNTTFITFIKKIYLFVFFLHFFLPENSADIIFYFLKEFGFCRVFAIC